MKDNTIENQQLQRKYIEEDEIDLRELFQIIMKRKKFIIFFTMIVTICATIFAFSKTPVYEVKAILEVGSLSKNISSDISNSVIENPNNLVKRLEVIYKQNNPQTSNTSLSSVSVIKNTVNLIEIVTQSNSNKNAKELLTSIIEDIKIRHKEKIDSYISLINTNINNLKLQKKELEDEKNRFDGSMSVKYNLTTKLNELALQISSNNIQETQLIGDIITNDTPIKPKKKLIVTLAFVSGLILSIFLVFFIEFINSLKKEEKNS